jgi:PAS domain S-box-containing protein
LNNAGLVMNNKTETILQHQLQKISRIFAVILIGLAALVLFGWQFEIEFLKRPFPKLVAMNPVTALAFISAGISFLLLTTQKKSAGKYKAGTLLASLVILIAAAKFASLIHGFNFQIDQFFFTEQLNRDIVGNISNRMALNTAFCFLLTGISLLLLPRSQEAEEKQNLFQYFSLFITVIALFSIMGYLYQVQIFYAMLSYIPMAIHSAFCFLFISLAIIFAFPYLGVMKHFSGDLDGSLLGRRLIPVAILVPVLIGLLRVWGQRAGLYTFEFGTAMLITSIIILMIFFIWQSTLQLNKRDKFKRKLENKLIELNENLELQVEKKTATLKESEEKFRNLIENSTDISLMDENFNPVYRSPSTERITGWSNDERENFDNMELIHPDDRANMKTAIAEILNAPGKPFHLNVRTRHKEGHYIWLDGMMTNMLHNNSIRAIVANMKDITARKKAEQVIKESEEKFRSLIERVSDGFIALDKNWLFTYANKKIKDITGLDPESLIGKSVWDVFPDAVGPELYKLLHKAMKDQQYATSTTYYQPFDLWLENHIYPSRDGLSIFIRDISHCLKRSGSLKLVTGHTI